MQCNKNVGASVPLVRPQTAWGQPPSVVQIERSSTVGWKGSRQRARIEQAVSNQASVEPALSN